MKSHSPELKFIQLFTVTSNLDIALSPGEGNKSDQSTSLSSASIAPRETSGKRRSRDGAGNAEKIARTEGKAETASNSQRLPTARNRVIFEVTSPSATASTQAASHHAPGLSAYMYTELKKQIDEKRDLLARINHLEGQLGAITGCNAEVLSDVQGKNSALQEQVMDLTAFPASSAETPNQIKELERQLDASGRNETDLERKLTETREKLENLEAANLLLAPQRSGSAPSAEQQDVASQMPGD